MTFSFAFRDFEALTFDCYGTLIDWESGILAALRAILPEAGSGAADDELLAAFGRHEAVLEAGPYRPYREILAGVAQAIGAERGVTLADGQLAAFGGSVADWPAFPDSAAALARLAGRYRLAVITNCDDDLFRASQRRLGVRFETVVTAQQVGAYKPASGGFHLALERLGLPRDAVLHVAQSLFHDHVPAKALGFTTAWIDRRAGRAGPGATPPAEATPDLVVPDMATFADLALA